MRKSRFRIYLFGMLVPAVIFLHFSCKEPPQQNRDPKAALDAMPQAEPIALFTDTPARLILKRVGLIGQIRNALCLPPREKVTIKADIPKSSFLEVSTGLLSGYGFEKKPVTFTVRAYTDDQRPLDFEYFCFAGQGMPMSWRSWSIDLTRLAGRRATIEFSSDADQWGALLGNPRLISAELKSGPNVLFLLVDALRPDRLGAYGYNRPTSPAIDRLAGRGTRFESAITASPFTVTSVASIFSGMYPWEHGVSFARGLNLPSELSVISEAFKDAGYRTATFSGTYFRLSLTGFDRAFDIFDESCANEFFRDSAGCLEARIRDWLEQRGQSRFFGYVHFVDPHAPYYPPDIYREQFTSGLKVSRDEVKLGDAGRFGDGRKWYQLPIYPKPREIEYLSALYDGEVRYVDDMIGRVIETLERSGLLKDTIIVLSADHGEALFEHDRGEHRGVLYDEVLKVPLIIAGPGIPQGVVIRDQVRTIDIMPTLLELSGLQAPERISGVSLTPLLNGESLELPPAMAMRERENKQMFYAVRQYPWKMLTDNQGRPVELYNLENDPLERRNLVQSHLPQALELKSHLP